MAASAPLPVLELVVTLVGVETALPGAALSGVDCLATACRVIRDERYRRDNIRDLLLELNRKQNCSSSSGEEGVGDLFLLAELSPPPALPP